MQLYAAFVSCWHITFCFTSFIGIRIFVSQINLIRFDLIGMSVRHFLHHHCHYPLLLLSSTPGSKLIVSTDLFLHSSSTFPPTGLTPRTPAVFLFFSAGMSVLTLALFARLRLLLVNF